LHGETDRLAVSVIWTMSSDFRVVKSCWYGRTVIHNCAGKFFYPSWTIFDKKRAPKYTLTVKYSLLHLFAANTAMTYEQADNILHDRAPEDPTKQRPPNLTAGAPVDPKLIQQLKTDLSILTKLARKKKTDREEIGGAIDLSSGDTGNELKFTLESGMPVKVVSKEVKEIHNTIAELMIMANTSVAERIHEHFPDTALLRIHRNVEEHRLDDLREVLKAAGLSLHGSDNKELAKSLQEAQKSNKSGVVKSLFQSLATRKCNTIAS
jgi:exoribonuclease R